MVLVSNGNGEGLAEVDDKGKASSETLNVTNKVNGQNDSIHISIPEKEVPSDGSPSRIRLLKTNSINSLAFPSTSIAERSDEISGYVPSSTSHGFRQQQRINGINGWKIDCACLKKKFKKWIKDQKEWIKDPYNTVLSVWITCVFISGVILILVTTGILHGGQSKESQRKDTGEVNNQIFNALFTLLCLYLHPKRFYHLVRLFQWKADDIPMLRKEYCKNGTYKPNERAHMMVVVVLLNVNCFAQYVICGLYLGFKKSERPAAAVGIFVFFAVLAPTVAGVYSIVSPLGKEYESDELDEESQNQINSADISRRSNLERRFSFTSGNEQMIVENQPKWKGGLFNLWDDIALSYLSLCCSCCIFGWNMERLGFGNMYVHLATFLLFCVAPFVIFNLAAINIDNESVQEAFALTGIILLVFGLLYGGFWRIQMRKRFNLPTKSSCCGKPAVADCAHWLFCCCCSLAQEVRTANYYDIAEDKFFRRQTDENGQPALSPLPREDGAAARFQSGPIPMLSMLRTENSPGPSRLSKQYCNPDGQNSNVEEKAPKAGTDSSMIPPAISLIRRDDNAGHQI